MKGELTVAEILGYTSSGAGVCRVGGRTAFVEGALLGELCEIKILKVSPSSVYAGLRRVLKPSPERRPPECPLFPGCGGCDLMHMSYKEELRFKLQKLNDALERIGGSDLRVREIIGADDISAYRNKAIYAVGEGPVTGFYKSRSHIVLPVERCLIQPELSDRAAAAVRRFMSDCGVPAYDERSGSGALRHVFTRVAFRTGESMACVVTARGLGRDTSRLTETLREACPELTSIVLCVNKSKGNTVLRGDFYTLWGRDTIREELCGMRFELSPPAFFQINPPQAERLYERALSFVTSGGRPKLALDLYCGAGTISLCLAREATRVIGAEIVPEAVSDARRNAALNGASNAEFICADASEAARELRRRGAYPEAVVVDPPRKGLSAECIDHIAGMSPERIVYLSCDPATLARDIKLFAARGYRAEDAVAVDMFPRTKHVESVALLVR